MVNSVRNYLEKIAEPGSGKETKIINLVKDERINRLKDDKRKEFYEEVMGICEFQQEARRYGAEDPETLNGNDVGRVMANLYLERSPKFLAENSYRKPQDPTFPLKSSGYETV